MTRAEQIELSDSLSNTRLLLERAMVIVNTMINDYFDKYDPKKDDFGIKYEFNRQSHFVHILQCQLNNAELELPDAKWVDDMKCEGGAEA